jgi:hypothetical protein
MRNALTIEQQKRVRELFEHLADLPADQRAGFLEQACGDDIRVRDELVGLLEESEMADAPFRELAHQSIWPALESLREDPSQLEDWVEHLGASETERDLLLGKTISRFEVRERIGRGGMGVVYRAHDRILNRSVALKFLPPAMSTDTAAKERFIHEAKAASGLDHPNIAAIHEIGETEEGQLYIAMGYYAGKSLKTQLEDGPLSPSEVLDLALQLVPGIAQAHARGVIHRDIKPGNIQICAEGPAKLLDFGLAKLSYESGYTQLGQVLGTIAYMSPEQARGEEIDHRTDLWSIGVVLYEALTGSLPFQGNNAQSAIRAILEDTPEPPSTKTKGIPAPLERIIGRCLMKRPEDRYQNAEELLEDLKRVREGLALRRHRGPVAWAARSRRRCTAGAVLAVAGVITITAILLATRDTTDVITFTRIVEGPLVENIGNFVGSNWGDYDGDGWVDVVVSNIAPDGFNHLYRNNGRGGFNRITTGILVTEAVSPMGPYFVDQDNDGDLDLFVTTDDNAINLFYRNEGNGNFSRVREGAWVNTPSSAQDAAWGDYDKDGYVDLFVGNAGLEGFESNFLYRNLGDGAMEAVPAMPTRFTTSTHGGIWTDFDLDGDVDLIVPGQSPIIFRNEGDSEFSGVSVEAGGIPEFTSDTDIGVSSADYDNDGDLDVLYLTWGPEPSALLYRNNEGALFSDVSHVLPSAGPIRCCGSAWGDYDNDGFQDLFICNGMGNNLLYHNEGDGTFARVVDTPVVASSLSSAAPSWVDYDNDGDLDLFVTNGMWDPLGQSCELYRNEGNANHWIVLSLIGTVSNRSAIGAKVWARATSHEKLLTQFREIQSGGNGQSGTDQRVHFGLAEATVIDTIRIEWPSGIVQELNDVAADQFLTIEEMAETR